MANVVMDNRIIEAKAKELLMTALDTKTLMTIDDNLTKAEGEVVQVNTYAYDGEAEILAEGQGNTIIGEVTYVPKEYRVQCVQQMAKYLDEDINKDEKFYDVMVKGMVETMVNKLTSSFYNTIEDTSIFTYQMQAGTHISYDAVVDALASLNVEAEEGFVLVIPNSWKAYLRKDPDFKTCNVGEIIHSGQIGTVCGLPVVATKMLDKDVVGDKAKAYVMSKEAVTLFVKKAMEAEQDRDANKRENAMWLREYYICALTDATKAVRIVEGA